MAKFADIKRGRRARRGTVIEIAGERAAIDVRVLGPDEDIAIEARALTLARKDLEGADETSSVYERYRRALVCLYACVDHDSPDDNPAPYFASVEEILSSPDLTRDHIAFLVEEQERWQDECSPRKRTLSPAEYIKAVAKTAEGDPGPFVGMSPSVQWSFAHSMATQLLSSLTDKSPPSLPSSETPTGS